MMADIQLERIRMLPFVKRLRLIPAGTGGAVEITTPGGKRRMGLVVKNSNLDYATVNALIGQVQGGGKAAKGRLLLVAPYVTTPVAKNLIAAGISFADRAGNIHLALGKEYNWTEIGERRPPRTPETERTTPATVQLLFQFVTNPESANWTVRELASAAGLSKSKIADLRLRFAREGILKARGKGRAFGITRDVEEKLVAGYSQVLRPKLVLGRYRYQETSVERFVARLQREAVERKIPYALSGGPGADAMQHFYSGSDVPLFLGAAWQRTLRLLPDKDGPVVLLKPFGELVYWREFDGKMIAPPWLVYAELLASSDPRAREAAEEFRREFLK